MPYCRQPGAWGQREFYRHDWETDLLDDAYFGAQATGEDFGLKTEAGPNPWNGLRVRVGIRPVHVRSCCVENFGVRLGIPEAKSFATLIRQSEELGTSLVQSLRVYSEEMRLKRLARAEEKAFALPVKLVLPLGFFIFPVVLGVTLLPVVIKLFSALGIAKGN